MPHQYAKYRHQQNDSGLEPDRIWRWRLCATAGRIGWIDAPLCPPPPTLPRDGDSLLALHAALAGIAPGLDAPALGWLIRGMAGMTPPPEARWTLAAQLAERLAASPDPLWQAALARLGPGRAAAMATALRRGALLETVTLWGQEASEARLAALETGLAALQEATAGLTRGMESLCRLAEYEALSTRWRRGDDA